MKTPTTFFIALLIALSITTIPAAHAELRMESINFDPAIIASGDDVDIVVQFHHEGLVSEEILLRVTVQNKGAETADAVDIKILKQRLAAQKN